MNDEAIGADDAPKFPSVDIQLVGNGYIITGSNNGVAQQFVARNIDDLTDVVRKIMQHPEGGA